MEGKVEEDTTLGFFLLEVLEVLTLSRASSEIDGGIGNGFVEKRYQVN